MTAKREGTERRRGKGKPFVKGDPRTNLKGRPTLSAEESYRSAIKIGCSAEDILAVTRKAVQEAKRGGVVGAKAREWLSRQLGTDAATKVEQEIRQTVVDAPINVTTDPELERLARELAARAYGPKEATNGDGNGVAVHA